MTGRNRQPKSVERREVSYQALKLAFVGKRPADDITPFMTERHMQTRKAQGHCEVTSDGEPAFLKNLFTQATTWGKVTENPVKQVRLSREDNARTRFWTAEEEARLLTCCNPRPRPLVITALQTGFRKSGLLSLQWANIDFRHRCIKVEAAYTKTHGARSVPMTETLTATLKSLKMSAAHESTVSVFGHRNVTKSFARTVTAKHPFLQVMEKEYGRRWAAGVAPGLQIQCSGLSPRWVGSIPIRLRKGFQWFNRMFGFLYCAGYCAG